MASETVTEANALNWKVTLKGESPHDTFNRKMAHAEALSKLVIGEEFREYHEAIQNDVLWLLSDLLTEMREAHDDAEERVAEVKA
jgi:hypothetical protein